MAKLTYAGSFRVAEFLLFWRSIIEAAVRKVSHETLHEFCLILSSQPRNYLAHNQPEASRCRTLTNYTSAAAERWPITHTRTHAHTHTFNGPLSETTWVGRYQKGKINLDFTEARDSEWQWHQLVHMQVCNSLQTDNHASTPPVSFLQAGCPSCRPTNSVKALKALCWPINAALIKSQQYWTKNHSTTGWTLRHH